jgi:hypothetical protein
MLANAPGRAKAAIFGTTRQTPGFENPPFSNSFGADGPAVMDFSDAQIIRFGLEVSGQFNFAVAVFKIYFR